VTNRPKTNLRLPAVPCGQVLFLIGALSLALTGCTQQTTPSDPAAAEIRAGAELAPKGSDYRIR
jgi:hypothetical protein